MRRSALPRQRPATHLRGVRRLAWSAVAATLLLISMGGLVRATDSGLACPDWPACYGQWIPPADLNIWLEHSHRLWAGLVMALIGWLAMWTTLRHRDSPLLWRLCVTAFALTVVQAGLGAAVVLALLPAGLVATHLATSLVIVGLLLMVGVLAGQTAPARLTRGPLFPWATGAVAAVFLQAVLGSIGTGHGIAYVFDAVPIWRADERWIPSARQVLHLTHRTNGYLVVIAIILLVVAARRARTRAGHGPWAPRLPAIALALVVLQVGLGLATALTRGADLVAAAHLTVASWLWAVAVLILALDLVPTAPVSEPGSGSQPAHSAVRVGSSAPNS